MFGIGKLGRKVKIYLNIKSLDTAYQYHYAKKGNWKL